MTAAQTGGGAPAPARIFRWEPGTSDTLDGYRYLRTDDDRPRAAATVAQYWRRDATEWWWIAQGPTGIGVAPDEDAARRACLLAVLHADDDERGEAR